MLKPHGDIYITAERELEPQFEQYRIKINPLDMHHVMAFADMYIGDSQTMAAEAGVLGVPFVRFNDFVGRIGYLRELEDDYNLGFGIKPSEVNRLYEVIEELLQMPNRKAVFQERRQKMLSEKIDFAKFLTWFIESYPESKKIMKTNPEYQYNFR
jgi:predicted glycosyltransferase